MNVWLPLCKYQVHQSHDIRFGHVGYLIVCKTTDILLKFQNYDEIMDPLNLSNLECTPAETREISDFKEELHTQGSRQKIVAGELLQKF